MPNKAKGFTLLELSISIAVISFLIAAVTAGRGVKHRLELNQIIEDISNISKSLKQFESTYGGIPGDLWNAEQVFDSANTNNGNGNTQIEDLPTNETLLFWQHLALAGLLEGTYDGTTAGSEGQPSGSLKGSLYKARTLWNGSHGNVYYTVEKNAAGNGLFTTEEAFHFDSQHDNSDPNSGSIRASDGANASAEDCITSSGEYNLTNNNGSPCILHFF